MNWSLPAADHYFRPLLTDKGFEIDHLEAALPYVMNWRCAVDGGAHIGTWSAFLAGKFERVIAFEPAPDTYECLHQNTQRLENVSQVRAALGARRASADLRDDDTRPGNTGARHLAGKGDVEVVALDDFGIQDLDLLKLDVEGYELYALQGAAQTILRCKPAVLIEEKRGMAERYGLATGAAGEYLKAIGYRPVGGVRNDRIFVYAQ